MSTEMVGTSRHFLTRFYAGTHRGTCLQVTHRDFSGYDLMDALVDEGWITLSKHDAKELIAALEKFIDDTLEESGEDGGLCLGEIAK